MMDLDLLLFSLSNTFFLSAFLTSIFSQFKSLASLFASHPDLTKPPNYMHPFCFFHLVSFTAQLRQSFNLLFLVISPLQILQSLTFLTHMKPPQNVFNCLSNYLFPSRRLFESRIKRIKFFSFYKVFVYAHASAGIIPSF